MYVKIKQITLSLAVILLPMMGCTVTSLSCGTDGASSYINLESKDLDTQTAKTLADLCNFSQEKT